MLPVKQIIINADDLGFSPNANEAILRCAERGTITAASVMVNMPFAEEALAEVQKRVPMLSLALHFTLTSGKPISPSQEVPMLVNIEGRFHLSFPKLWYLLTSKKKSELLVQIQIEFAAQLRLMDRLTERYSLKFDHIDSHQHVHVLPGILQRVQQESVNRQISMRVPREHWGHSQRWIRKIWTWKPQNFVKQAILNYCLRTMPQQIGYFGILESGRMDKSALSAIIQSVGVSSQFNTYEINVHPSLVDLTNKSPFCCSKGDEQFHLSPWRQREFQALDDNSVLLEAKHSNVALSGFGMNEH